jgi:hypothetical protein
VNSNTAVANAPNSTVSSHISHIALF